ncbi:hypothetical protein GGF31_005813 [Allomyces arbusculus]|nr:hypothetical protein GGF31_005813 [Allomyces arbusculus]
MFSGIKQKLKEFGVEFVEDHVRPPLQEKATRELETFRSNALRDLPDKLFEQILKSAARIDDKDGDGRTDADASAFSSIAGSFVRKHLLERPERREKLQRTLRSLVDDVTPSIVKVTDSLDENATEFAVRELKVAAHLVPAEEQRELEDLDRDLEWDDNTFSHAQRAFNGVETVPEDPRVAALWPTLDREAPPNADRATRTVHRARRHVRKLVRMLLPVILAMLPMALHKAVHHLVTKELDEEFSDMRGKWSWLDGIVNYAQEKTDDIKDKVVRDLCETVWERGCEEKTTRGLVGMLVQFEAEVMQEFDKGVRSLPVFGDSGSGGITESLSGLGKLFM